MKLEELHIHGNHRYSSNTGYSGSIKFSGGRGTVELKLDDTLSRRILAICADEMVIASKRVARELTAEIIEQATVPAIEAKP